MSDLVGNPVFPRRSSYIFCVHFLQHISLTYDGQSGKLKSMKNLASGVEVPVKMEMMYYDAHPGNCSKPEFQPSGAYVFRPNTSEAHGWVHSPGTSLVVK